MKKATFFPVNNFVDFKNKLLNWVQPFNIFCLLDNGHYHFDTPAFECLLAAGCKRKIVTTTGNAFLELKQFNSQEKEWLFGHLSYDLKNETEQLCSLNPDGINFPDCQFFVPEIVIQLNDKGVTVYSEESGDLIFAAIESSSSSITEMQSVLLKIKSKISFKDYINIVKKLQQHILRGDCYEINFCQEFFANNAIIEPLSVYSSLVTISPNPFCALYKLNDR